MRKIILSCTLALSFLTLIFIGSCTKSIDDGSREPITIIRPDSLSVRYVAPGHVEAVNIQFTTDRPIILVKCMYEIDSPGIVASYTFPNTLFYTVPTLPDNKYTYNGSYSIPATIKSGTVIRFDVKLKAFGNPSSADTVNYEKQFKMTVR